MTKSNEPQLKLIPPREAVVLPSDVIEHVLDEVAALVLQVQRAEEGERTTKVEEHEVKDEASP